jgi:hypothetical protein
LYREFKNQTNKKKIFEERAKKRKTSETSRSRVLKIIFRM